MALKFFDCKGYGQIEPNQVWFNRAGMSEAQCELDSLKFASHFPMTADEASGNVYEATDPRHEQESPRIYGENGAFLMVDKANRTVTIPNKEMSDKGFPMGINYSTERIYNQFTPGRRNFCMICGEFYPRIGFVEPGMRITTNAVAWDNTVYTTAKDSREFYDAVKDQLDKNTTVYAVVTEGSNGKLVIGADPDDALGNVYAQVVQAYTNADGTLAFKFQFVNKPV